MTMLAITLTFLIAQASLAAIVWAFITKERKSHDDVKNEKDTIIKAKNKLLSEAKLNRRLKSDADTVNYLERSNEHLMEIVARFDTAKTKNKELRQQADSVRELEMDNQLLGKDAKLAEELEDINQSLKLKISRIPDLEKENGQLLLKSQAAQQIEEKNESLRKDVEHLRTISSENAELEISLKHLRSDQRTNLAKRSLQKEAISNLEQSNSELEEGSKYLDELEEKNSVLTALGLKAENLAKENATLERESARYTSVTATNFELRQIVEKVQRLEFENDELEVAAEQLEEAEELNEVLKEDVDVDRLIALQSENTILRQQAQLATQLEAEKEMLLEKSQQISKMRKEIPALKENAAEFQDVFQYYISLKECADQVSKLRAVNKELEQTANLLPDLKKHNDELKRGSNPTSEDCKYPSLLEDNVALKEKSNSAWRLKAENKLLASQSIHVEDLKARLTSLKEQGKGIYRLQAEIKLLEHQAEQMEKLKEQKEALREKLVFLEEQKGDSAQESISALNPQCMPQQKSAQESYVSGNQSFQLREDQERSPSLKAQVAEAVNGSLDGRKGGFDKNAQSTKSRDRQPNSHSSIEKIRVEENGLPSPATSSSCAYGSFNSEFCPSASPMLGTMAVTAPGRTEEYIGIDVVQPDKNWEPSSLNKKAKSHPWSKLRLLPFLSRSQSKAPKEAVDQTAATWLNAPKNTADAQAALQECTSCLGRSNTNDAAPTKCPLVDPYLLSNALDSFGSRLAGSKQPLF